jgi:hypothetical protein
MTKTDECSKELEDTVPEYIKSVGTFQYENEDFALTGHYISSSHETCQVCGHTPIVDVYVVSSRTKKMIVGNVCINRISNQRIEEWFRTCQRKKNNIEANRELIDTVNEILHDYENDTLSIYISEKGVQRLQKMLDRMCNGINPMESQESLAQYYIRKIDEQKCH